MRARPGERKKDHFIFRALDDLEWRLWFLSMIGPDDANGCQRWLGSKIHSGHSQVHIPKRFCGGKDKVTTSAARVMWFYMHPEVGPKDHLFILHECRTPNCCRVGPQHVKGLGTASENQLDRYRHARGGAA